MIHRSGQSLTRLLLLSLASLMWTLFFVCRRVCLKTQHSSESAYCTWEASCIPWICATLLSPLFRSGFWQRPTQTHKHTNTHTCHETRGFQTASSSARDLEHKSRDFQIWMPSPDLAKNLQDDQRCKLAMSHECTAVFQNGKRRNFIRARHLAQFDVTLTSTRIFLHLRPLTDTVIDEASASSLRSAVNSQ